MGDEIIRQQSQLTMNSLLALILLPLLLTPTSQQVCDPSEYFDGQHCAPCQQNCICTQEYGCSQCLPGYTFDSKYQNCLACPTATDAVNVGCTECCSQISGTSYVCSQCPDLSHVFLIGGQCIRMLGCTSQDTTGRCKSCQDGYYLFDGACQACHSACSTCVDNTLCLTCAAGYFNGTNSHYGFCNACSTGCSSCTSAVACTACFQGYLLSSSVCNPCPLHCTACTVGGCTSCETGYAILGTSCVSCTNNAFGGTTGCLSCAASGGSLKCTKCADSYYLGVNGACNLCTSLFPNSRLCTINKPLQCLNDDSATLNTRYYLVGNTCVLNTKNCKKMKNSAGDCSSCYFEQNYYYQLQSATCTKCVKSGCATFSSTCSCLSCLPRYQYINFQCVPCQNLHCYTCQNDVQSCEQCAPHYGIQSSACITCQQSMCLNCDGDTSLCVTCEDGYYNSNGICYRCQTSCEICTSATACSSCASGTYLDASGRCKSMPSNCLSVSSAGLCTKCEYGYRQLYGNCFPCSAETYNLHQCENYCPSYYALRSWQNQLQISLALALLLIFMLSQ